MLLQRLPSVCCSAGLTVEGTEQIFATRSERADYHTEKWCDTSCRRKDERWRAVAMAVQVGQRSPDEAAQQQHWLTRPGLVLQSSQMQKSSMTIDNRLHSGRSTGRRCSGGRRSSCRRSRNGRSVAQINNSLLL